MTEGVVRQLRARLPDCGEGLCAHYADQVRRTGQRTTATDAFDAWTRWLIESSGDPATINPYRQTDWTNGFHDRTALVIREVSRYVT